MRQRDDHGATMTTSPADMPVLRRHRERRLRRHLGRRATPVAASPHEWRALGVAV